MTATRQAIMSIARTLLLPLLPAGKSVLDLEGCADMTGERFAWLAQALHFPEGTKITGVSVAIRFLHDEICFRLESPDFVETAEGEPLPQVAMSLSGWTGPAVNTPLPPEAPKFREFL